MIQRTLRPPPAPRALLAACLGVLAAAGCECDKAPVRATSGELEVDKDSVAFGELCLEGRADAEVVIRNIGDGDLTFNVEVDGPFFAAEPKEGVLDAGGGEAKLLLTYHPTGDEQLDKHHFATLKITTDAEEGEKDRDVVLDGETSPSEPKGIASFRCGDDVPSCLEATPGQPCCTVIEQGDDTPALGRTTLGLVNFGDTPAGAGAEIPVRVENLGCGPLQVEGVTFTPSAEGLGICAAESAAVATTLPVEIPGSVDAAGRAGADLSLRFSPTELCSYTGRLTIETTDPDIRADDPTTANYASANVLGAGTEGRVAISPRCLSFGEVLVGDEAELFFHVSNVGTQPTPVTSTRVAGSNPDYEVVRVEVATCDGQGVETGREEVELPYTLAASDALPCGPDEVDVTVRYAPTNPAGQDEDDLEILYEGGSDRVCLRGGSSPRLITYPDGLGSKIDFSSPTILGCFPERCGEASCQGSCVDDNDCPSGPDAPNRCLGAGAGVKGVCAGSGSCVETCAGGERVVQLCNEGLAPLQILELAMTGPQGGAAPTLSDPGRVGEPIFSFGADGCTDQSLEPPADGARSCCEVAVRYTDTRHGGVQRAELHVYSTDPLWGRDVGGYVIPAQAITQSDLDPQALFDARASDGGLVMRADSWITLDAAPSTDDGSIVSYAWELLETTASSDLPLGPIDPANPNASCPPSVNGGECFRLSGAPAGKVLEFFPDVAQQFKFRLTVSDGVCAPPHEGQLEQFVEIQN